MFQLSAGFPVKKRVFLTNDAPHQALGKFGPQFFAILPARVRLLSFFLPRQARGIADNLCGGAGYLQRNLGAGCCWKDVRKTGGGVSGVSEVSGVSGGGGVQACVLAP